MSTWRSVFRNDSDSYRDFQRPRLSYYYGSTLYMTNAARDAALELVLKALIN